MGCGCGRNKSKTSNKTNKGKDKKRTLSLDVYRTRKSFCNGCKFASKLSMPHNPKIKVLTNKSICRKSKRQLIDALKDPGYHCPLKKF